MRNPPKKTPRNPNKITKKSKHFHQEIQKTNYRRKKNHQVIQKVSPGNPKGPRGPKKEDNHQAACEDQQFINEVSTAVYPGRESYNHRPAFCHIVK